MYVPLVYTCRYICSEGGCITRVRKRFGLQTSKRKWIEGGELVSKVCKAEGMPVVRKEK